MDVNKWIKEQWFSKIHDWLFGFPLSLELIQFYITLISLTFLIGFFINISTDY